MSWDVELLDKQGEPLRVPAHCEGAIIVMGGNSYADLNVTYNYSKFYYQSLDIKGGLGWLNGRKAKDCIPALEKAVLELGTVRDEIYYKATPGNAGAALNILLGWAHLHPEAIFQVD